MKSLSLQMKTILVLVLFGVTFVSRAQENAKIPEAPEGYRRPAGYDPAAHRYKYSLNELKDQFSEKMMQDAGKVFERVLNVNAAGKWKPIGSSLDRHVAPEWFEDLKFGMFINWGLWSVGGWAAKNEDEKHPMYPDWYENLIYNDPPFIEYHKKNWGADFKRDDLIPFFQARDYQPDKLVDIALECGMKYVIPYTKHHSGFCIWPSSYTHRNAGVMLGKDLLKPIVDNCKKKGLKYGFYFSTDEWEYPVFDVRGGLLSRKWSGIYEPYTPELEHLATGKIAVEDFAKHYVIPQAVELIDLYDPDILWLDGEWETPVESLGAYEIAAYYYNRAEGRKEVAVNDRYGLETGKHLRSYRGDFFASEFGHMANSNKEHPVWEECRGISQSFGFNWQDTDDNVITSKEFVDMFVDIVSKGGNLLMVVNLDAQGALPEIQEKRLKDIGKWLKVNGEGIYFTRAYTTREEGNVRYTRSKDNQTVYAISLEWPGSQMKINSVKPADQSKIYMLGYEEPLKWTYQNGVTTITLPSKLQKAANRPCDYAYTFRIQTR